MALSLARTNLEGHIYMDLTPCRSCGQAGEVPSVGVFEVEGDLASHYAGPCPGCGTHRSFTFRIPEEVIMPDYDNPTFGDDRPSELIDAGQWIWVAERFLAGVPPEPVEAMTAQQRNQARSDLLLAAAALDEAVKFIPADASAVPRQALRSETGRVLYAEQPGRFHRRELDAERRAHRELAQRLR